MSACLNCGTVASADSPTPSHCGQCPPTVCEECGETCYWQTGDLCSCWTSLEGMALADIKALFADDCDGLGLSVSRVPGEES